LQKYPMKVVKKPRNDLLASLNVNKLINCKVSTVNIVV
jgi:hypothetical protein